MSLFPMFHLEAWECDLTNPATVLKGQLEADTCRSEKGVLLKNRTVPPQRGTCALFKTDLIPGEKYKITFEAEGKIRIYFFDRGAGRKLMERTFDVKKQHTVEITLPRSSSQNLRFDFGCATFTSEPALLKKVTFTHIPDPEKLPMPDRAKMKKGMLKKTARWIVCDSPFDEKKASAFPEKGVTTVRFLFHDEKDLAELGKQLEICRRNKISFTLEYEPSSYASENLLPMFRAALKTAQDMTAYGVAVGKNVPGCADVLRKLLPSLRKEAKDLRLIVQPLRHAADYRDFTAFDDPDLLYTVPVNGKKDLSELADFSNVFCVSVLADRVKDPVLCESRLLSWSIEEKDLEKFIRPMHKNLPPGKQFRNLLDSVGKARRKDSAVFIVSTDDHYLYGFSKLETERSQKVETALAHAAGCANLLKADCIADLGDLVAGSTAKDKGIPALRKMMKILKSSGRPVCVVKGNHDDGCQYVMSHGDPLGKTMIRPEEWFAEVTSHALKSGAAGDSKEAKALYFYFDILQAKLRLIFLAVCDNPMIVKEGKLLYNSLSFYDIRLPQMRWLAEEALNFSALPGKGKDWSVITLAHTNLSARFADGKLETLFRAFEKGEKSDLDIGGRFPGKVKADFSKQGPRRILAHLFGHSHCDWEFQKLGILNIGLAQNRASRETPGQGPRTGADSECWSVFVVTPSEGRIELFRSGMGLDRSWKIPAVK